jgi:hypothetical protein
MRRFVLFAVLLFTAAAAAQPPARPPFELEEATIADLQQRMQSGRATARSLAEQYLARHRGDRPEWPDTAQRPRAESGGARDRR